MDAPDPDVTVSQTRSSPGALGDPRKCFYCTAATGTPHDDGCVCLTKSVVMRVTVEYVASVPRSWGKEDIEFHRNESSSCANNQIRELSRAADMMAANARPGGSCGCFCSNLSSEYLRDATAEDERHFGYGIADLLDE